MRIGIVSGEFPPMTGGVGACSQILARRLSALGHELRILSGPRAASDEFPLARVPANWGLPALTALRRWARHHRLEIVNLQFQTAAFNMSPCIHFLPHAFPGVPLVTTFHDLRVPWLFPKAGPLRRHILHHLARSSAAVISTNHEDHARLRPLARRAALIPIGSNILAQRPADFDAAAWRRRHGLAPDETLLAWFGLVNHSKGLEPCSAASPNCAPPACPSAWPSSAAAPATATAAIAPSALPSTPRIARLQLQPALLRTGYLPDREVAAWLWASDLVVLPYRDGASFRRGTLMAAIRHGCATVTTIPRVSIPDFAHGHNLWLLPPDDAPGPHRRPALSRSLAPLARSPAPGRCAARRPLRLGRHRRRLRRLLRSHPPRARMTRRLPRRDLVAAGLLLALWLFFFWRLFTPVAADQASLRQGDFSGQFVAFGAYQFQRLSQGQIPLWNPWNNAGMPFLADPQTAVFYPPRLLTIALANLFGGWSYHALSWKWPPTSWPSPCSCTCCCAA